MAISYSHCLLLNQLRLRVHLGNLPGESAVPQAVDVSLRFYFPSLPDACRTDSGDFVCYDTLSLKLGEVVGKREFKLIEYLTLELYNTVKSNIPDNVKIWIRVDKVHTPVTNLLGGASFIFTDLPPDAARVDV